MSSYSILKINKETKECLFLMANAVGTRTFRNDFANAWSVSDHRIASDMLTKCKNKHRDGGDFEYMIDDLDESAEH